MELRIENLSKTYSNGTEALKGVSLTIPQGMFGLLGPNGAGKSTLMRTIATLQEPDTGSIHLGKIDALGVEPDVAVQDWIDIGIFADERVDGKTREVPLYLQKHRITGDTTLTIRVDRAPDRAGIDPYNKLIDRTSGDNVKRVTGAEE